MNSRYCIILKFNTKYVLDLSMTQKIFIIEDMGTGEKISVGPFDMSISDASKAIEVYDRLRRNRNRPRKSIYADDHDDLSRAYQIGKISRSTYYRRLKALGIQPKPPKHILEL